MSVPKNYRPSPDDGLLTALLLGPLVAAALLCTSLSSPRSPTTTGSITPAPDDDGLPPGWAIEPPLRLPSGLPPQAGAVARAALLLVHVCAAAWLEARAVRAEAAQGQGGPPAPTPNVTASGTVDAERRSVPRSEALRGALFLAFALGAAAGAFVLRLVLGRVGVGVWRHLTPLDTFTGALFYQLTLYVALRMAHRGFTLGELGLVCFGGAAVFMEGLGLSAAGTTQIWPITTPYIKTFRLPTPLVVFQTALIAGPFLVGFLLAPLLVLSRHAAQTPARRRRRTLRRTALPTRRRLALALLLTALLLLLGPIGLWTRWALRGRDPWRWALGWVLARRRRVGLLVYWGLLGGVSVRGWMGQVARGRRWRGEGVAMGGNMGAGLGVNLNGALGLGLGGALAGAGTGAGLGSGEASPTSALFAASGELLDRAPTLGLNARRKFFHALVVVMFVPGVAFDPAFTHLAFSVAFALFVFAEYVRYFAIYPLGAAVHLFMNEFLDSKDGGTAILSHFYLLTGCAGALWLEGPSRLLQFTGVLVLGLGDALASIVGKRHGRHAWSPTTPKTLEGSAAFVAAIVASAWALRLCGLAEPFSTPRYVLVVALAAVLEALSDQNDNLTLPLYTWSALVLAGVTGTPFSPHLTS
ncbi:hypothetical protein B0H11DRAFT_2168715 [Mycena galericulata]|nr:hypothetical protein B0H11DRAFT_2168715 [Mycena galericulata]